MQWMIAAVSGALLAAAATMAQAQPARGETPPIRTQPTIARPAELARLRDLQLRAPPEPSCPELALVADVVALDHPMVFNRIGAQNINWMMYALRHDVIDVRSRHVLDHSAKGNELFKQARSRTRRWCWSAVPPAASGSGG